MREVDRTDLVSGALIIAIGMFFFIGAQEYRMGTMSRMGPGFVPYWLGAIAMFLGGVIALTAIGRPGALPAVAFRPLLAVTAAVVAFALILPRMGLVTATFIATVVSMIGNDEARPKTIAITAVVITAVCWTIFIGLLGLPIRTLRWPF
ncbi:MAG: tripartite tricarboxylate transporter TctB family protein [Salinarimonadaceae bacterium]|nr:MAG: tripartite tricarboxylate transporter TctB family protein [Salinarimonadaceae bacterium]